MAAKSANRRFTRTFYHDALDEAEKSSVAIAREVEGIDDELVMLRLRLRTLAGKEDFDLRLLLRSLDALRRLVETKHRLTKEESTAFAAEAPLVREELERMLTEVAHDGNTRSNE